MNKLTGRLTEYYSIKLPSRRLPESGGPNTQSMSSTIDQQKKSCHCLPKWPICHCQKHKCKAKQISDDDDDYFLRTFKMVAWFLCLVLLFLLIFFVSYNVALYCLGYNKEFCSFNSLPRFLTRKLLGHPSNDEKFQLTDSKKFDDLLKNLQLRLMVLESEKKSSLENVEFLTKTLKQIETEIVLSRSEIRPQIENEFKTFDSVVNEHLKILQSSVIDVESEQIKWNEKLTDIVSAVEIERQELNHLKQNIESLKSPNCSQCTSLMVPMKVASGEIVSRDAVDGLITSAIDKYDADKTGRADYALESSGGSILSIRCTETYSYWTRQLQIWNFPLYWGRYSPRTVISPGLSPGECWAFKGSTGYLVIKLAGVIQINALSYEHIPMSIAPDGHIDSAPKQFEVFGLMTEDDQQAIFLGKFTYDKNGRPLQYFPIRVNSPPVPIIELKFLNNHGFSEYTCLYRFRVHGNRV